MPEDTFYYDESPEPKSLWAILDGKKGVPLVMHYDPGALHDLKSSINKIGTGTGDELIVLDSWAAIEAQADILDFGFDKPLESPVMAQKKNLAAYLAGYGKIGKSFVYGNAAKAMVNSATVTMQLNGEMQHLKSMLASALENYGAEVYPSAPEQKKGHHKFSYIKPKKQVPAAGKTKFYITVYPLDPETTGPLKGQTMHHIERTADGRLYQVYGSEKGQRVLSHVATHELDTWVKLGYMAEYTP